MPSYKNHISKAVVANKKTVTHIRGLLKPETPNYEHPIVARFSKNQGP